MVIPTPWSRRAAQTATIVLAAATGAAYSMNVPERMILTKIMKNAPLRSASVLPLDFGVGVKELEAIQGDEMIGRNTGRFGSVAFVVRRPGWVLCREHGQQLLQLAAEESKPLEGFGLFGLVKETGVDDEGLIEFHKTHYPHPLYKDVDLEYYRAFGDKKVYSDISWNPLSWYGGMKNMQGRLDKKGLEGNLIGEGLKKGGIIIFGTNGEPTYMYLEETGTELELEDIKAALAAVKEKAGVAMSHEEL
jgi:hypothetical protein